MNPFEKCQNYILALQNTSEFTEEDMSKYHPYNKVIHRRVDAHKDEQLTKRELSKARNNCKECDISLVKESKKLFEIEMNSGGLSCYSNCHNTSYIKSGAIPLNELSKWLTINISDDGSYVIVGGEFFRISRCYYRVLNHTTDTTTITVGEALECSGKADACKIDYITNGFGCYWDRPDHAILCLQNKLTQPTDTFELVHGKKYAIFNQSIFDYDAWTPCGSDSDTVKIPSIILKMMHHNDVIIENEIYIHFTYVTYQHLFKVLLSAYQEAPIGPDTTHIDILLHTLYENTMLTTTELQEVYDIIEIYVEDIYDGDTSYWYDELKPDLINLMKMA